MKSSEGSVILFLILFPKVNSFEHSRRSKSWLNVWKNEEEGNEWTIGNKN